MRYRLYKKSKRAWDAIMAEIKKAKKSHPFKELEYKIIEL